MKILGDASNEAAWLLMRRGYVSASDIFKLLSHDELCTMGWWKETWMDETKDEIFQRKLDGTSPEFRDPVAVQWGKVEEDHNRELFTTYSGIMTIGCHSFIGHDRWPYLSTTLDGFSFVPTEWDGVASPEMFDDPHEVEAAIRKLPVETRCLLEMKQTSDFGLRPWQAGYSREPVDRSKKSKIIRGRFRKHGPGAPVYYHGQIQTQMALAGFDWNIAVVKGGASHMAAQAYQLDPTWLEILDAVNERVAQRMEDIRGELNNAK